MKNFDRFLTEGTIPGKNLHMTHLEDQVFEGGITGGEAAIAFLQSVVDMLAGNASGKIDISVKWDGAPAIFAGIDPEDGEFFVSSKGVFNKTPKLVKKPADVEQFSAGLRPKLLDALKYLKPLGIQSVIQGDLMYTRDDLSVKNIDGEKSWVFQPNTIVYTVPVDSDLGRTIAASKIGIVFHTTYNGKGTLADYTASFGVNTSKLKSSKSVWVDDASYRDVSGKVLFTEKESAAVKKQLTSARAALKKVNGADLKTFLRTQKILEKGSAAGSSFATYNNTKVRAGEKIKNPRDHARGYIAYFDGWWDEKAIGKVKSEKAKKIKTSQKEEFLRSITKSVRLIEVLTKFQVEVATVKDMLVKKLDGGAKRLAKTFIQTANGYKVVGDEGYVAIDRTSGGAVKLVDRMEFSFNNFTAVKNWTK